jgi:type I restriction enzyme S subunit
VSELPSHWTETTLRDAAILKTGPFGSTLHKSDYVRGGTPIINPMHINNGRLFPSEIATVSTSTANRLSEYRLQSGDVVLGRRGEMGRCAVVQGSQEGWLCGTGSLILRPRQSLDARYLQRFLSSPGTVNKLVGASVGSTMVNLNQGILFSLGLPLPPLAEQIRIADKLETVIAKIDLCRARLDRVPQILNKFREAVLEAAVSGKLTEEWRASNKGHLPWVDATFGSTGYVSGGLTKNATRAALAFRRPYLRVANVYTDRLELDDVTDIGMTQAEWDKTRLQPGDVLIVEGNGSIDHIGRAARWGGDLPECSHQNHLIRWRTHGNVDPRFALLWLMSPVGRSALMDLASTSAGLYTLSISKISKVPIRVPSTQEQAEVIRRSDDLLALADALLRRHDDCMVRVKKLTPSVLSKAFRGELVPQDPNDEPVGEMLERLRLEREVRLPCSRERSTRVIDA